MNGANPPTVLASSLPGSVPDCFYRLLERLRGARRPLSALSFWGAIALPAVYLPWLVAGIDTTDGLLAFLAVFGLHVLALFVGRRHRRPAGG